MSRCRPLHLSGGRIDSRGRKPKPRNDPGSNKGRTHGSTCERWATVVPVHKCFLPQEEQRERMETPSKGETSMLSTPGSKTSGRRSGKRISEIQKRFTTGNTGDSKKVDMNDSPISQSATKSKVLDHEVKVWLERNVVTWRDF